ncbi:TPA: hypothetical protein JD074_04360 [Clostridioides difficile]|uniref:helix-turn-helix domain-containing protein n=1 Tax=Clostridioides difficile TaxID=1496 RepID=UPI0009420C19|nr:helix-turn-helix domain-containing protein [Clostridioides difficile]MBJ9769940.1 helix-turn-helix domain-containing protein [Clostridioides difficile]MDV9805234.1 helix-turn-helix domain-containing protein [Clostridioides difficile]MDV9896271.1 helix-turn-helix domain-containing protein [Clostridioides difficile]MDV9911315.1 helix-turn-helix domain-containing protein [Clostridioides difficile]VFE46377.1 Uncharacterised protein [Clostridioides difficile]
MSNYLMEKLTTNSYKILKIIYDNQIIMKDGSRFTPMTQAEMAENMGVSKITINTIIKELQDNKLIYTYKSYRGRYCLTKKAMIIIDGFEIINAKLKEIDSI